MIKIQRLQDHLIASGIVAKEKISVFIDEGKMEWAFSPNDNSYGINYTANLLIRDYNSKQLPIHLLFFTLASFFDEKDATRFSDLPIFQTAILDQDEADIEFKIKFSEDFIYKEVEKKDADLSINNLYQDGKNIHLKLIKQEQSDDIATKGNLVTLYRVKDNEFDL